MQRFVAPTAAVHVPAALAGSVTGVIGLDTEAFQQPQPEPLQRSRPGVSAAADRAPVTPGGLRGCWPGGRRDRRSGRRRPPTPTSVPDISPRTGTPAGCPPALAQPNGFTPNQYRQAYNIGVDPAVAGNGRGERVALIEIDGFKPSDITTFASCFGLPTGGIKVFHVGVHHNLTPSFETTLDLEMLLASAPGVYARGVGVYQSRPTGSVVLRALTAPLRHPNNRPDVISASLGHLRAGSAGERVRRSRRRGRVQPDARGGGRRRRLGRLVSRRRGIDRLPEPPQPDRDAVAPQGGQLPRLLTVGDRGRRYERRRSTAGNGIARQVVWNNSPGLPDAGGGGYSRLFRRPAYQRGFTRSRHRVVPDVSMLADPYPGYLIYCSARPGCVNRFNSDPWTPFGGTSAGAPLLAGSFALVDAELRMHGYPNLGFANPLLYKIARSKLRHAVFRDVRLGSNDVFAAKGRGVGCCSATRGFDAASGLGSVNIGALMFAAGAETHRYARLKVRVPRQRHVLRARALRDRRPLLTRVPVRRLREDPDQGSAGRITAQSRLHMRHRRGRSTVMIRLPRQARARIAKALRHHHRVTAYLYAAIVDPTGKIEHHTHATRLRLR